MKDPRVLRSGLNLLRLSPALAIAATGLGFISKLGPAIGAFFLLANLVLLAGLCSCYVATEDRVRRGFGLALILWAINFLASYVPLIPLGFDGPLLNVVFILAFAVRPALELSLLYGCWLLAIRLNCPKQATRLRWMSILPIASFLLGWAVPHMLVLDGLHVWAYNGWLAVQLIYAVLLWFVIEGLLLRLDSRTQKEAHESSW